VLFAAVRETMMAHGGLSAGRTGRASPPCEGLGPAPGGEAVKDEPAFFDFAAEVGLTKHIGGLEATDTLVELMSHQGRLVCPGRGLRRGGYALSPGQEVRLPGRRVDISERMVERSRERARREKVTDRVEFRRGRCHGPAVRGGRF